MSRSVVHVLNKQEALAFVRERSQLFDEAGRTNPFACADWVLNLIEQVAEDSWTVIVPESVGDGESVMLLYSDERVQHKRTALTNYYASLYSPLISTARDRSAALGELVGQLADLRPASSTITFAPLDRDAQDTAALAARFSGASWYVRQYFCFGNWHLPCAGLSFEQYMNVRPAQLHNTWKRKAKKFHTAQQARLEIVTEASAVDAAMDAYEAVYAKSWKKPEPYPRFIRRWARICAEHGWLRLGLAWVDDVPIAVQFWFTMHRRAYIFKLAYDEDYAKWSAGTVLTAHLIRHALENDAVVEIDYLTGDDPYKQLWMTHRRERIGMIACNRRSARGMLAATYEYAGALRKRWQNSTRPNGEGAVTML
jgi:CelD/BcsL family acetyltransferase involved in cellulose biosynthesis